jgi:hypothetical protein
VGLFLHDALWQPPKAMQTAPAGCTKTKEMARERVRMQKQLRPNSPTQRKHDTKRETTFIDAPIFFSFFFFFFGRWFVDFGFFPPLSASQPALKHQQRGW